MECILIKGENHYRVLPIDRTFHVKFYGFFLSLENLNSNNNITYPPPLLSLSLSDYPSFITFHLVLSYTYFL